jgi:hypothetical protein
MKKYFFPAACLFFIGMHAACTINFPYDFQEEAAGIEVVMQVTPDDADVLLDGRLIGSAYEFSTPRSALRLASRHHELAFSKKGYQRQFADLSSHSARNITLRIELQAEEPRSVGVVIPRSPTISGGQTVPGTSRADEAKSEPLPPLPAEKPVAAPEHPLTLVMLTVTPAETAIYIDGKFWGLAPETGRIENLRLRPGKYVFEAFKPGFRVFKQEVTVTGGEQTILTIAMQK